jgi:hypothetical protein
MIWLLKTMWMQKSTSPQTMQMPWKKPPLQLRPRLKQPDKQLTKLMRWLMLTPLFDPKPMNLQQLPKTLLPLHRKRDWQQMKPLALQRKQSTILRGTRQNDLHRLP